ncbi:MAG: hypothetical protein COX62_06385 [Deltaproteobacteria bacterium CG_4_10_14_0_2_um_filter_43_8]|nr:MAG: hypothetical protein COV43_05385 [Deltaproteobacteria bacterium CG11_big_fil_rev_8_21_14_0_20_42_23]PJA19600.1 MAG: hypothetical protein COX62_06385 [Deltaproteobacteria bacterium CG_4_10_14_0_2_um_filter_43_8]PJC64025.1 MAG: hypothetical protein CO021_06360 [Deltaproteobacteria bacterium CG_4_9_14_0_2_um_filter_42_21]
MAKKNNYRLQALLTLKERLKRKAEIVLAQKIIALKKEEEKLEELKEELKEIVEAWKMARKNMSDELRKGASSHRSDIHSNYLKRLKEDEEQKEEEMEEQKECIEEAKEALKKARRNYIDAAKELQVMQKHKELWAKKLKGEISKKEAKELNDLGNTIHQLKAWKGEKSVFQA